jgi:transcriptional regulator with XRE-family HTH domain
MPTPATPGQLLRARRLAHGLTQSKLAIRAGTTQAAISRIERSEVSPTFDTLAKLLSVLGEEPELDVRRGEGEYDRVRLRSLRERPPEERLRLAISWNRLAGEFARAGARARGQI